MEKKRGRRVVLVLIVILLLVGLYSRWRGLSDIRYLWQAVLTFAYPEEQFQLALDRLRLNPQDEQGELIFWTFATTALPESRSWFYRKLRKSFFDVHAAPPVAGRVIVWGTYDSSPDVRKNAIEAWRCLGTQVEGGEIHVLRCLDDSDVHVACEAVMTLPFVADYGVVRPELVARLGADSLTTRILALRASGIFGVVAKDLLPVVQEQLNDPEPRIRAEAEQVCSQIAAAIRAGD